MISDRNLVILQWQIGMGTKSGDFAQLGAVQMRNTIRTTTRTSMKDVEIADFLNTKEVNMTWDEAFLKYNGEYEKIIDASMRGRSVVDVLLQIPK